MKSEEPGFYQNSLIKFTGNTFKEEVIESNNNCLILFWDSKVSINSKKPKELINNFMNKFQN